MSIDPVGVVGLGLLGRGIAASLVGAGVHVIAFDISQPARQDAFSFIENAMQEMVSHGVLAPQAAATWPGHLTICDSISLLQPSAFVIESVNEDLAVKRQVFEELEAIVGQDTPIASNTSALPITLLQQGPSASLTLSRYALVSTVLRHTLPGDHSWGTHVGHGPPARRRARPQSWQGALYGQPGRSRLHHQSVELCDVS